MKKYFYFLFLLFITVSCTEDVKFNNPAFQALKDNVFWRAPTYEAGVFSSGTLIVTAKLGSEQVILQIESTQAKTYTLGSRSSSAAIYFNDSGDGEVFNTEDNASNGQITITDFDVVNKTVSGTFRFTAVNVHSADAEKQKVTFTEGVFYKVPVTETIVFEN